jgi:indole-3-acetate monooxygenase
MSRVLRGTGSFDWTVEDVFLPERRMMPQVGIPFENQWSRWPGLTYQLPVQCWVGPHHSAVITGIARAGIDALVELAGGKQPRGRPAGLLCDSPQVQDAVGRADAILNADSAREAMDLAYRHGGSMSFKRESRLAECWRDLHTVGQTVTLASEFISIGIEAFRPQLRRSRAIVVI